MRMMNSSVSQPQEKSYYFLMGAALLLGFALPISLPLVNVALGLLVIGIIWHRDFHNLMAIVMNPLFYLPLSLFGLLVVSLLFHDNSYAATTLSKYRKLLYILPVALFFLQARQLGILFFRGFIVANGLVLLLSVTAWLNWFPVFNIDPENPTVFHLHISQNFFMSIACLAWLVLALRQQAGRRWGCGLLFILGVSNILFMVQGRTGYVTLAACLGIWLWLTLQKQQKLFVVAGGVLALILVVFIPNQAKDRLMLGLTEVEQCVTVTEQQTTLLEQQNVCETSMGMRTYFAFKSIELIKQSPIFGAGVGGFAHYSVDGEWHHVNPHNEYLMQLVNVGIVGFAIFLLWIIFAYKAALTLRNPERNVIVAVLTAYMAGNFFNSFIFDSIEGHAFVFLIAYLLSAAIQTKKLE